MGVRRDRQAGALRRWAPWAVLLFLFTWTSVALAQAPTVAYVDLNRVLDQAPQVAAAKAAMEVEFRDRNRQFEEDQLSLDALKQEMSDEAIISTAPNPDLERRIASMERAIKRKRDALSRELDARRQSELARIDAMIGEAIGELARERKLDLVLTDQVVYYSPRIDLTDAVISRLRERSDTP